MQIEKVFEFSILHIDSAILSFAILTLDLNSVTPKTKI